MNVSSIYQYKCLCCPWLLHMCLCVITPDATMSDGVLVGDGSHIGPAVIVRDVEISVNVIVGVGAVILKTCATI